MNGHAWIFNSDECVSGCVGVVLLILLELVVLLNNIVSNLYENR